MSAIARTRIGGRALRRAARDLERDPFLLSGLAGGGWVEEFEDGFGRWLGAEHVLATSSATGALVVALRVLGVGPGDEVVLPSYCWVGCAGAIRLVGATPVWADIRADTFQVDPACVVAAIGPRTAAILAPHLCGHPCDADELAAIARARDLALVEDASQAPGAAVAGVPVGRWGDLAVFSFGPGKLVAAGEGGMLVCRSALLRERALLVAQHPLRQAIEVREPCLRPEIGGGQTLNFRIHPLAAVLAAPQIAHLDERLADLARRHAEARALLGALAGVQPAALPAHHRPNGATLPLRLDRSLGPAGQQEVLRAASEAGLEILDGPIGTPCHLRAGLKAGRPPALPCTERRCSGEEFFARVSE